MYQSAPNSFEFIRVILQCVRILFKHIAAFMTIFDLIDIYQFDHISTTFQTNIDQQLCRCCSMVEEMNEIRKAYNNNTAMQDVIRRSVCNRHEHQYCIDNGVIDEVVEALMKSSIILSDQTRKPFIDGQKFATVFCDFEELYDFVSSVIASIKGIGPLTIYNTAKRIGHLLFPASTPNCMCI